MANTWIRRWVSFQTTKDKHFFYRKPVYAELDKELNAIQEFADNGGWTITGIMHIPHEAERIGNSTFVIGITIVATLSKS